MKNKWTSVNDAMPDTFEKVLVYVEHKVYGLDMNIAYVRDITIGKWDGRKWKTAMYLGSRVTAWMDLPTPPERMV